MSVSYRLLLFRFEFRSGTLLRAQQRSALKSNGRGSGGRIALSVVVDLGLASLMIPKDNVELLGDCTRLAPPAIPGVLGRADIAQPVASFAAVIGIILGSGPLRTDELSQEMQTPAEVASDRITRSQGPSVRPAGTPSAVSALCGPAAVCSKPYSRDADGGVAAQSDPRPTGWVGGDLRRGVKPRVALPAAIDQDHQFADADTLRQIGGEISPRPDTPVRTAVDKGSQDEVLGIHVRESDRSVTAVHEISDTAFRSEGELVPAASGDNHSPGIRRHSAAAAETEPYSRVTRHALLAGDTPAPRGGPVKNVSASSALVLTRIQGSAAPSETRELPFDDVDFPADALDSVALPASPMNFPGITAPAEPRRTATPPISSAGRSEPQDAVAADGSVQEAVNCETRDCGPVLSREESTRQRDEVPAERKPDQTAEAKFTLAPAVTVPPAFVAVPDLRSTAVPVRRSAAREEVQQGEVAIADPGGQSHPTDRKVRTADELAFIARVDTSRRPARPNAITPESNRDVEDRAEVRFARTRVEIPPRPAEPSQIDGTQPSRSIDVEAQRETPKPASPAGPAHSEVPPHEHASSESKKHAVAEHASIRVDGDVPEARQQVLRTSVANQPKADGGHSMADAPGKNVGSPREVDTGVRQNAPTRHVTLQLAGPDRRPVEVVVHERNGRVHVEVKTSDKQTAVALRSELSELARAVQGRGYHIDTWTPSDTAPANMHEPSEPSQQPSWSEGEHQRQPTGDTEQGRDQRKKHAHDPEWLIELQRRLSGEEG